MNYHHCSITCDFPYSECKSSYTTTNCAYNNGPYHTTYCISLLKGGRRGRDRMVVGFTTTMYLYNKCLSPLKL